MKKIKNFILSCSLLIAAVGSIYASPLKDNPKLKKGTLSNGLEYYIIPNVTEEKKNFFGLYIKAGACMEEENEKGIAHFVEHCCFNETDNFKVNEVKNYFQSIGMKYGSDLNGYTNENKTFYIAAIPSENEDAVEKTFTWFYDIAGGGIHFREDECQDEKQIVFEEWQLTQKNSLLLNNKIVREHFVKGSEYETAEVTGTSESIKSYDSSKAKNFYDRWYRTDNMILIAVGDFDITKLETKINEKFSDIKKPSAELKTINLTIPEQKSESFICIDKEITCPEIHIFEKLDDKNFNTEEYVFNQIYYDKIIQVLNNRLVEKSQLYDCPYLKANISSHTIEQFRNKYICLNLIPKENQFEESIKAVKSELSRLKEYGITKNEYEQLKNAFFTFPENISNLKLTVSSKEIFNNIILNIEHNQAIYSPESNYLIRAKADRKTTLKLLNQKCKELFINNGQIFEIKVPENFRQTIDNESLFDLFRTYEPSDLEKITDEKLPSNLMNRPFTKARIESKEKNENLDSTVYTLSNGLRLILKKSKGEPGHVRMLGISEGGLSQYGTIDFSSGLVCPEYSFNSGINGFSKSQTSKIINGKNYTITCGINENYEFLSGDASSLSVENLLQYVHLIFNKPYFTNEGWNETFSKYNELYQKHKNFPLYSDYINQVLYSNDIRYNITDYQFNSLLNQERSEKIFKERFSNAADFTFIFAGDFDESEVVDLCCSYLGTINGDRTKKEKAIDRHIICTEKEKIIRAKKNPDAASSDVYIFYFNEFENETDPLKNFIRNEFSSLISFYLNMKLSDKLREEEFSTYTVNENLTTYSYPASYSKLCINFSCKPEKADSLLALTENYIKELLTTSISDTDLETLKSTWIQSVKSNKHVNQWWINRIENIYIQKTETDGFIKDPNIIFDEFTKENFEKYMNLFINKNFSEAFIFSPKN